MAEGVEGNDRGQTSAEGVCGGCAREVTKWKIEME